VVKVEFDIAFADEERNFGEVKLVEAVSEYFSISTQPADPGQRPDLLLDPVSKPGRLEIDIEDPEDIWIILRLRLFRDVRYDRKFEGVPDLEKSVAAGTLSVMGAGVWAVTCSGW
jgi:hypothetical protein